MQPALILKLFLTEEAFEKSKWERGDPITRKVRWGKYTGSPALLSPEQGTKGLSVPRLQSGHSPRGHGMPCTCSPVHRLGRQRPIQAVTLCVQSPEPSLPLVVSEAVEEVQLLFQSRTWTLITAHKLPF